MNEIDTITDEISRYKNELRTMQNRLRRSAYNRIATFLLDLWPQLEKLVNSGHCTTLGTADLNVDDLGRVYDGANTVKPVVNHYNVAACCSVPHELSNYAKQHTIALLTHNDPHPFLTTQQVQEIFAEKLKVPVDIAMHWEAKWVGRSTAIVETRSVIASKGYLVHFHYIM